MAFSEPTSLPVSLSLKPAPSCPLPAWHPWGDAVITIPCRSGDGGAVDGVTAQSPSWDDLLGTR
jgi:hypothetical protein